MKRVASLILSLLCCTLIAWGQGEVHWLEQEYDFGTFKEEDGKASCTMRLVNTGDSPLVITRVQSSCGCTATDYPIDDVMPGDTAAVTVTYNPANRPGQFEKDIWVYTTGTPRRSQLKITGKVIGAERTVNDQYPEAAGSLRLEVANVPLGELYRGTTRNAYINAYNASNDTLVVSTEGSLPHVQLSAVPDTVPPGEASALVVHYDTRQAPLWGLNVDTLLVYAEPLHNSPTAIAGVMRVYVMAQVMEDMRNITPEQREKAPVAKYGFDVIDFGSITPGALKSMLIGNAFMKNTGKSDLLVRRVWCPDKAVTVLHAPASRIKKGGSSGIDLRVDPAKLDGGLLNTTLTIITNDPGNPVQQVRLVGYVSKQPVQ